MIHNKGTQLGFVEDRGSHCGMRALSIFAMGPSSWKLDTSDWLKLTFLQEKCDQIDELRPNFYFEEKLEFLYERRYKYYFLKGALLAKD